MQGTITTYRVSTHSGETIYQTTDPDVALEESRSGHRVTAISQSAVSEDTLVNELDALNPADVSMTHLEGTS